jgi:hypothetical protein
MVIPILFVFTPAASGFNDSKLARRPVAINNFSAFKTFVLPSLSMVTSTEFLSPLTDFTPASSS